jgi:hypothetical protein
MLIQKAVREPAMAVFAAAGPRLAPRLTRGVMRDWSAYKGRPATRPAQPAKAPAAKPKESPAPAPTAPKPAEPRPLEPAKKGNREHQRR